MQTSKVDAPKELQIDQKFLPLERAMEAFGLSRSYFYKLKAERRLFHFSLGSRVFIDKDELERLIASGRKS